MSKVISAASWNLFSSIFRSGLQLIQLIILTRFLSPQDYGLMAMAMLVISYASMFSDMGLSTAFIQRQHITNEERSSIYWLSVAIGIALMLLVMAISPLASYILKEPKLTTLIILASTNFFATSLGQQLRSDAEKTLNFRPIATIEIAASALGFATALTTGWIGWGVYALITAAMVSTWSNTIMSWVILSQGWRPMWRLRWNEVRWFANFGGGILFNNIINQINSTVDLILGGRLLGITQLGLYSVPRNLILQIQSMINPIFTRIGFPLISSIQNDPIKVKHVYLKVINITATINSPIYIAIILLSTDFVHLLLGDKFQDSAPLLRVLAAWGLLRSFANPVGSLIFGLGRVQLAIYWNIALLLIVPPALWYGSQHGALGMSLAMTSVMLVLFIPGWAILIRPTCGAGLWEYSQQMLIPTSCAILAGIIAWLGIANLTSPWLRIGTGLAIGATIYTMLFAALNKELIKIALNTIKNNSLKIKL